MAIPSSNIRRIHPVSSICFKTFFATIIESSLEEKSHGTLPWLQTKKAMGFAPMAFAFLEQKTTWAQVPKVEKIKIARICPAVHGQKSKRNQLFCQAKSYKNLV
jgi:hypothetical protein